MIFPLSKKAIDFILSPPCFATFLEGTTKSGKTTVAAGIRFMLDVSRSDKKLHILASRTKGTAEKNIILQDNGILDIHRGKAVYFSGGNKNSSMPHIEFEGKIIYVLGYDDVSTWKNILGGQYGCAFVDECQTADPDFLRELILRVKSLIGTLNPDDPRLPIYTEFINHSRPYKEYTKDVPDSIMRELLSCEPKKGWTYWFFTFEDNLSVTKEDKQRIYDSCPPGSKQYKNKVLGLRGKATGLVFPNFSVKNIVSEAEVKRKVESGEIVSLYFSCGVDTSYSKKSDDTTTFIFMMITEEKQCIVLDEAVFNNKNFLDRPFSPSDTIPNLIKFLDKNCKKWGFCRHIFIDSADAATITEAEKYVWEHGGCPYDFSGAYKGVKIYDRITMQLSWIYTGHYLVCDHCKTHIQELQSYSWDEKHIDTPEDRGDHTINASQYGWIPFRWDIGTIEERREEEEEEEEYDRI